MATSIEILNNIRDTISNLVDKYKEQSTANETTKDELKEIDKELGDCLNLLMSIDTSLTSLNSDDLKSLLTDLENKQQKIDLLLDLETTINEIIDKYNNGSFNGKDGEDGKPFTFDMFSQSQLALLKGNDGKSAYQVAVNDGFIGTETEWLESLKGTKGKDGKIIFEELNDEQKATLKGTDGIDGSNGKSAYQIAVHDGFIGTEIEWLDSLKGTDGIDGSNGKSAYQIAVNDGFIGTETEWLESLKGSDGKDGIDGKDGSFDGTLKTINNQSILGDGNLVVGIPKGLISMWSGTIATIPNGWFLCDGNNGTPPMQDKFVMGTTVQEEIGQTGGSANAVVIAHSHTGSTNTTGNHSHSVTTYGGTSQSSGYNIGQVYGPVGAKNFSTASAGNHSHTLSINSSGEDGINKNLPPYYKLAFIMKG